MDKEKQIEEMARIMCNCYDSGNCKMHGNLCDLKCISGFNALGLYNAGYRKIYDDHQRQCTCYALGCQMAEELKRKVAREIFEEMREELVRYLMLNENIAIKCKEENGEWNAEYWKGKLSAFKQIQGFIDVELKQKYTESENDNE